MEVFLEVVGALQENCYIVASEQRRAAVIDPGDDIQEIVAALEAHDLTPVYVLLTHGHFDHIGAVNALKEKYGLTICAHAGDTDYLTTLSQRTAARYRMNDQQRFVVKPDCQVADGDVITLDELTFRVMSTPGHSAGSVCYFCGDCLFSGDTLFAGDIGRCDMTGSDYEAMKQTLERLKAVEGDYRVLPGHGPASALSREKIHNPYMTGVAL